MRASCRRDDLGVTKVGTSVVLRRCMILMLELRLQHIRINLYVGVCDLVDKISLELVVYANNQVGRTCDKLEKDSTHVACKDRFRHVATKRW